MDFWQWLGASVPAGALLNGLGLGALAILFATDRILTKGQHLRRVADIQEAHAREIRERDVHYAEMKAEKDARYTEMKESRDYYRQARLEEKERGDSATEALVEVVAENTKTTLKIAESIQEARHDGP